MKMRPSYMSTLHTEGWILLLLVYSVTKMAAVENSELQPLQASMTPSCPVMLTSVRMEVAPLLLYTICQDNSSAVLRITCGPDVWFEIVTGFCNSFDLNIGRATMSHLLESSSIFLDLVKTNQVLDTARVVILDSDHLNRYRISVWGQRNTRFILSIVRRCEGKDYDSSLATPYPTNPLSTYLMRKTGNYYQDTLPWPYDTTEPPNNSDDQQAFNSVDRSQTILADSVKWQKGSTFETPSMKSVRSQQSWQGPYRNTQNNPRSFHSDSRVGRLTRIQTPEAKLQMHHVKHFDGGNNRWSHKGTSEMASMFTAVNRVSTLFPKLRVKKDSISNTGPKFQEQSTEKPPIQGSYMTDAFNDNLFLSSSQGGININKKSANENQLSMYNNNPSVHYPQRTFYQLNSSEKVEATSRNGRKISIVKPNLLDVMSKKHQLPAPRKLKNSSHDSLFLSNNALGPGGATQKREARGKSTFPKHMVVRPSLHTPEYYATQIKSQPSPSPRLLSTGAQTDLMVSKNQNTLIPAATDHKVLRFYFPAHEMTNQPNHASVLYTSHTKQFDASNVKHGRMLHTSFTSEVNQTTIPHLQAAIYANETGETSIPQDLNYSLVTPTMRNGKQDLELPIPVDGVISTEKLQTVLPHTFDVYGLLHSSYEIQPPETLTWSKERSTPTTNFVSETAQYVSKVQTSNVATIQLGDFLASEPFVYTLGDQPSLQTPMVKDSRAIFDTNSANLEIYPTSVVRSIETSRQPPPNEFLESEPFYYDLDKQSTHTGYGSSSLGTSMLSSDLAIVEAEEFNGILSTSTSLPSSMLSASYANSASLVIETTFTPIVLPSTSTRLIPIWPTPVLQTPTVPLSSSANSSEGEGYSENENEGIERDTFWPVVAALVVGIPSVIVFGIAITVFHRRRAPDPQKLFTMQTLRSATIDTSDSDMTTNNMETPMRNAIS